MSACSECGVRIDDRKPISVRVYVQDAKGKEQPVCVPCWSGNRQKVRKP